jgi:hypothetical protein
MWRSGDATRSHRLHAAFAWNSVTSIVVDQAARQKRGVTPKLS